MHFDSQAAGYLQPQLEALYRTIEQRFHALPGVKNVGISSYTPMEDNNWSNGVQIQGQPFQDLNASIVRVSPEYFDSVGTHVLGGRGIGIQDSPTAPAVAVVNQTFVKIFFPSGADPIGQRFGSPGPESQGDYQIVGVVDDTAYTSVRWKNHSMYFLPLLQRTPSTKKPIENDTSLYAGAIVLETQQPVNDMEQLARETLSAINPNLALVKFQTFADQIADRFNEERMVAQLTALFGALALLLAAVGLYGVTAYTVACRTAEIGIRMALGAPSSSILSDVMRSALIQTVLGLVIGIPTALLSVRFVETQLYEVKGINASVLTAAILTLVVASILAGLIPARRAASTDPAQTLRTE